MNTLHVILTIVYSVILTLSGCSVPAAADGVGIEKIQAESLPFQVRIRLTKAPEYKVVRLDNREILIAFNHVQTPEKQFQIPVSGSLKNEVKIAPGRDGILTLIVTAETEIDTVTAVWLSSERTLLISSAGATPAALSGKAPVEKPAAVTPSHAESPDTVGPSVDLSLPAAVTSEVPRERCYRGKDFLFSELSDDPRCEDEQLRASIQAGLETDWAKAFDMAKRFIEEARNHNNDCLEIAYYIKAYSFYKLIEPHGDRYLLSAELFQSAVHHCPGSRYSPYAMAFLGTLHLTLKNYTEAQGYFKIIQDEYPDYQGLPEILFDMARVHMARQELDRCIPLLEEITYKYPDAPFITDARICLAEALFRINNFSASLQMLNSLVAEQPRIIFERSDILECIGNSYYQLGDYEKAREALSRLYNYFPDNDSSDIVLSRIGDTYRDQAYTGKALKVYDLVIRTFPDTNGAIISSMRTAELSDDPAIKEKIYREVIRRFPDHHMASLSMLRLAMLENDARKYEQSVETLRQLLGKKPRDIRHDAVFLLQETLLRLARTQKEAGDYEKSIRTIHALLASGPDQLGDQVAAELKQIFEAYFTRSLNDARYPDIVSCFHRNKAIIEQLDSPGLLLMIGSACFKGHLYSQAVDVLTAAEKKYADGVPPRNLLLLLSICLHENGQLDEALIKLRCYADRFPEDDDTAQVHARIGRILLAQQDYEHAEKYFRTAFQRTKTKPEQARILLEQAKACRGLGHYTSASTVLVQAINLLSSLPGDQFGSVSEAYRQLGLNFLSRKMYLKAADAFEMAVKFLPDPGEEVCRLKYMAAEAYEKGEDLDMAEKTCRQMAGGEEPFWAKLAGEKIRDMALRKRLKERQI